jgi:hypothetical protein
MRASSHLSVVVAANGVAVDNSVVWRSRNV